MRMNVYVALLFFLLRLFSFPLSFVVVNKKKFFQALPLCVVVVVPSIKLLANVCNQVEWLLA